MKLTWPTPAARANIRQRKPLPDLGPGISQLFKKGGVHTAIDFFWLNADPAGSRQVFGDYGVVSRIVKNDPGYGNCLYIRVSDKAEIAMAHLASINVEVGDYVTPDTMVAVMGHTGSKARGVHLHWGLLLNGLKRFIDAVDPMPYLTGTKKIPGVLVPRPLAPNERLTVSPAGAWIRPGASKAGKNGLLKGNVIVTVEGFERGENVGGDDVWFKHSQGYSHASGFTDQGTHDLPDLTPVPVPPVTAPAETAPPVVIPPVTEPPVVVTPAKPDDDTPSWFIRFITAIVDALKSFLGGR